MHEIIDLTALVLSAICVAETDDNPMSAVDIAFMLDVPQEDANQCLDELVLNGSILLDGRYFRLRRPLNLPDMERIQRLHDQLEQVRPIVEMLPVRLRLDS